MAGRWLVALVGLCGVAAVAQGQDTAPPRLGLVSPEIPVQTVEASVELVVTIRDASAWVDVTVEDETQRGGNGEDVVFVIDVEVGEQRVFLLAEDAAGNRARFFVDVFRVGAEEPTEEELVEEPVVEEPVVEEPVVEEPVVEEPVVEEPLSPYEEVTERYDGLIREYVDGAGFVDYGRLQAEAADELRGVVEAFAGLDVESMGEDAEMAYWINVYNAVTLEAIVEAYPLESIKDLNSDDYDVWQDYGFGPEGLSLNAIEHEILRPMGDPRIHAAIVCASKGCPPLRNEAYWPEDLDAQLEDNCRVWINDSERGVRVDGSTVYLSEIFNWFGGDFGAGRPEHVQWILQYADPERSAALRAPGARFQPLSWDWALNDQG